MERTSESTVHHPRRARPDTTRIYDTTMTMRRAAIAASLLLSPAAAFYLPGELVFWSKGRQLSVLIRQARRRVTTMLETSFPYWYVSPATKGSKTWQELRTGQRSHASDWQQGPASFCHLLRLLQ